MLDNKGRKIEYLRLSITKECNLRCIYCIPEKLKCEKDRLDYKKYIEIVDIFSKLGIKKVRITGGEPLMNPDFLKIISGIQKVVGIEEVGITTNGLLLDKYLDDLELYGIKNLNISLDSLNRDTYRVMTRGGDLEKVLLTIEKGLIRGFKIKLNVVLIEGYNENEIDDFIDYIKNREIELRFIELMPIGEGKKYGGINNKVLKAKLEKDYNIESVEKSGIRGPVNLYKISGYRGKIGFITPISDIFCNECNRVRVSAKGILKLCLYSEGVLDLDRYIDIYGEDTVLKLRDKILNKPKEHNFKSCGIDDYMNNIGG